MFEMANDRFNSGAATKTFSHRRTLCSRLSAICRCRSRFCVRPGLWKTAGGMWSRHVSRGRFRVSCNRSTSRCRWWPPRTSGNWPLLDNRVLGQQVWLTGLRSDGGKINHSRRTRRFQRGAQPQSPAPRGAPAADQNLAHEHENTLHPSERCRKGSRILNCGQRHFASAIPPSPSFVHISQDRADRLSRGEDFAGSPLVLPGWDGAPFRNQAFDARICGVIDASAAGAERDSVM
jgi:hypothetical protein